MKKTEEYGNYGSRTCQAHARTVPVEGAIATFHSEVKLRPCTSVLRIVLQDIIINTLHKLKVWMTIVESGWNVWVWLVGVVTMRRVWLVGVGGIYGCG